MSACWQCAGAGGWVVCQEDCCPARDPDRGCGVCPWATCDQCGDSEFDGYDEDLDREERWDG